MALKVAVEFSQTQNAKVAGGLTMMGRLDARPAEAEVKNAAPPTAPGLGTAVLGREEKGKKLSTFLESNQAPFVVSLKLK